MTKYIKTGTTEFEQFDGSNKMIDKYELIDAGTMLGIHHSSELYLTGSGKVDVGDWIATGVDGEHWPVKDEIFQKAYKKLPTIPKALAKWVEACRSANTPLLMMLDDTASVKKLTPDDAGQIEDWMKLHTDYGASTIIACAWINGYEVAHEN